MSTLKTVADQGQRESKFHRLFRHREPLAVEKISTLDTKWQFLAWAILFVMVIFPLTGTVLNLRDGWVPVGDQAIIAMRSSDVGTDATPLLGQPTTTEGQGGDLSNQLGPSEYWLLAPFVAVFGQSDGSALGAAALTISFLVGSVLYAFRHGGLTLMALLAVGLTLAIVKLGTGFVHDPTNSELPTFAVILALMACWACLNGDRWAFPVLVATASFIAQAHIASASTIAVPTLAALYGIVVTTGGFGYQRRSDVRNPLVWSVAVIVALAMWLPTIFFEITKPKSNIGALLGSGVTNPSEPIGTLRSLKVLGQALGPIPLFMRHVDALDLDLGQKPLRLAVIAVVVILALVVWSFWLRRGPDVRLARLTMILTLAVIATVASYAQVSSSFLTRVDISRWRWSLPLLLWVTVAWSLTKIRAFQPQLPRLITVLGGLLVGVALAGLLTNSSHIVDRDHRKAVRELATIIDQKVPRGHYLVGISGGDVPLGIGPGVVSQLEDHGFDLSVRAGLFSRAYGPDRAATPADSDLPIIFIVATDDPEGSWPYPEPEVVHRLIVRNRYVEVLLYPSGTAAESTKATS